jgi:glycosyltransferase involved in cell wall biosynthesis
VVLGMQGAQMPANAVRGIGRWANEFVVALCTQRPEAVAAVSVDPILPLPRAIFQLPPSVKVVTSDERLPSPTGGGRLVFHALSPLEDLSLDRVWPRWARDPSVGLVATVYDMIPALFPGQHFNGPLRWLLRSRYEFLRRAGAIVTISEATGRDVAGILGIPSERIFNAYSSVAPAFVEPHGGRTAALAAIPSHFGISPEFLLSIGNVDSRKNLPRLLRAFATLPPSLRSSHQLVLTCSQDEGRVAAGLADTAARLGVGADVVVATMVDDPTMVALYQSCRAMVFPSLYEGLGLPLIEAMCCGAVALASDVGAMQEIVRDPDARFNPTDVPAISAALRRVLTDDAFVERRRAAALGEGRRFTWERSVGAALGAYAKAVS